MPITSHVGELRVSLAVSLTALLVASSVAYVFFKPILKFFQAPLNEQLYYTSPAGGFTFAIKLCLAVGIIAAIPVLVNRVFSFTKPVIPKSLQRAFAWYSLTSVLLAVIGVAFAYYISLPSALDFLTSFNKEQIQALITVDAYFNFVITYLIGYALLFQTPIIMLFINRVKPLEPGSMMKVQRHVLLGSFVVAALLTPTPDPWNQLLMALPIILLYQAGIIAVWLTNRNQIIIYNQAPSSRLRAKIPSHLVTAAQSEPRTVTPQAPQAKQTPVPAVLARTEPALNLKSQQAPVFGRQSRVLDIVINVPKTA